MLKPLLAASSSAVLVALTSLAQAACKGGDDVPRDDICKPRDIYLMPGVNGVAYAPNGTGIAPFYGAGVHFAPYQWSHNNDHFGPSQGSIFIEASLLRSSTSKETMALLEGGGTLSFERNSSRTWLIPYFGNTLGGILHGDVPKSAYDFPFGGIHGIYTPHVMLDVQAGYMFPFRALDTLRGPRGEAVLRVSLW